ncbi:MAG: T9SS type A sorting domain-containing protein [Saprospiraceae bacterium]|nr:T9SS type A sorting domain-containing protein [Saprospiraceae bacterium]
MIFLMCCFNSFNLNGQTGFEGADNNPGNQNPCNTSSYSCSLTTFDFTFQDGHQISSSGTFYQGKTIKVLGELIIDQSTTFRCCFFSFGSGASIIVNSSVGLTISDSELRCGSWNGIFAGSNNFVSLKNNYFSNFTTALMSTNPFHLTVQGNHFISTGSLGTITGISLMNVNSNSMHRCFIAENYFQNLEKGIEAYNCQSLGIGYYSFNNNLFSFCRYGIYTNKSILFVNRSIFEDCRNGFRTASGEDVNGSIFYEGVIDDPSQYSFNRCLYGAEVLKHTLKISKSHFNDCRFGVRAIFHSEIALNENKYINTIDYTQNLVNQSDFVSVDISNTKLVKNIVERNKSGTGFFAFGTMRLSLLDKNEFKCNSLCINRSQEPRNFIIDNKFEGYSTDLLLNKGGNDIHDNTFTGDNSDFEYALRINQGFNNKLCNNVFNGQNTISNGRIGLNFRVGNNAAQMGINTFKNWTNRGLLIDKSDIGRQYHLGNIWENNNTTSAECIGDPDKSLFYVNPSINSSHLPATRIPTSGWFFSENQNVRSCPRSIVPALAEELTDIDVLEIGGQYQSTELNNWLQTIATWSKIDANPDLLSDPEVEDYYNSKLETNVEYISKRDQLIYESKNHPSFEYFLDSLYDQLVVLHELIADINEQLQAGPNQDLETQKLIFANEYDSILLNITYHSDSLENYREHKLNEALDYNQLISTTETFDEYEQWINQRIISKMLDADFVLSSSDYAEVLDIAYLCYDTYGSPVLRAVQLLDREDITLDLLEDHCPLPITKSKDIIDSTQKYAISYMPEKVVVEDKDGTISSIILIDMLGRIIYKVNSNELNTVDVPKGVYILEVQSREKTSSYTTKIIL